jgi:ketosteroid isomerase-like protein
VFGPSAGGPQRHNEVVTTPLTLDDLLDLEAIKRVKYAYIRCVDTKGWDELASLLTEDAVASYSSGKHHYEGRPAIMEFLSGSLGDQAILSSHRVQHPEITLHGDGTATAVWALDDTVIMPAGNTTLRGSAYYTDEMVKVDGDWKIRRTGYRRLYEEIEPRDHAGLTITDRWFDHADG